MKLGCLISIIFLGSMFLLDYCIELLECSSSAKNLGYSFKYDVFAGCIIENKAGKKMLLKQLRNFEE